MAELRNPEQIKKDEPEVSSQEEPRPEKSTMHTTASECFEAKSQPKKVLYTCPGTAEETDNDIVVDTLEADALQKAVENGWPICIRVQNKEDLLFIRDHLPSLKK